MGKSVHISVMMRETVDRLNVRPGGVYLDATLGGGGHAAEILRRAGPSSTLLGIDRDLGALERAKVALASLPGNKIFVHGNHCDLEQIAKENLIEAIDGALIDTGVSSDQLDVASRGFSFRNDAPLDMRMDQTEGETAADLLRRMSSEELADIFRTFGEEPRARQIAEAIVKARKIGPVARTQELADLVVETLGAAGRARGHHPATKVFQALRMALNGELEALGKALEGAMALLRPGGRLVVITFESLSDRLVKHCFASHVGKNVSLQQGGSRWEGLLPRMRLVDRRAVLAQSDEIALNPRSRSAKLRCITPFSSEEDCAQ